MNHSSILKALFATSALACSLGVSAGNIPQYAFSQTRPGFEFLTDATPVTVSFKTADEVVFPDRQTLNAYTGQGFQIGFDFRYGGKVFNQFAIDNNGYILLGYDKVEFKGYSNLCFLRSSLYASNSFYMGLTPSMFGIKSGDISYKLTGEEGNRVLTVEFAHMNVNEPNARGNAIYSQQIQLFEKDGKVNISFVEEESPYSSFGLITGIVGWSDLDTILITSPSPGKDGTVSSKQYANMLEGDTLIRWSNEDVLGDTHKDPYTFCLSFVPTGEPDFVSDAPGNLNIEQIGDEITVTCDRAANAPATAILISEKPIEKFPEQGVTYPVVNDNGEFITTFDDATLVYYNNGENPTATFPNVKSSTRYYVKAFGVNGYPSYSTESSADAEFMSSHPAPYVIMAESANNAINIKTVGDDQVIIAATVERVETSTEGATGIFGFPEADSKPGDALEGGGEIIYVGDPGDFVYSNPAPNRQVFLRAWSLKDGRVSKTSINASGVTLPQMPYEPQLELYTLYEVPLEWIGQTTSESATLITNFIPRVRGEKEDEAAIAGVSIGTTSTLISPVIPFGQNAKLSFEWSLETTRDMSDQAGSLVQIPEGREPGKFGKGHSFEVSCGARGTENSLFTATEYTGTMKASAVEQDRYISGTSEFLPVSVDIPANLEKGRFTFKFSTEFESILYMRNIVVTGDGLQEGVNDIFANSEGDIISGGESSLSVISARGGEYNIYSLDGRRVGAASVEAGEGFAVQLEKGIYVVNNRKVVVF